MSKKVSISLSVLILCLAIRCSNSIPLDQEPPTPLLSFGNPEPPDIATIDWEEFWALFNTVSAWNLEYNNGSGWFSIPSDLTVIKNYTKPWLCKINLIFHASYTADYRLTFLVDRRVKNYTHIESKTRYLISYQNYSVFFDWGDLLKIPGLQFSHGVKEIYGKPCFWFRIRRNSLPKGTYLELDPWFGNPEGELYHTFSGANDLVGCNFTTPASGSIQAYGLVVYAAIGPMPYPSNGIRLAIYDAEGDKDFIVGTEQVIIRDTPNWIYAQLTSITQLENSHNYYLCVWFGLSSPPSFYLWYQAGSTNQMGGDIQEYGPFKAFPSTLTPDTYWDEESCIACYYYDTNFCEPSVGCFESSQDPVYSNSWFNVNCTVNDPDGIEELNLTYLGLSGDIHLGWQNGSIFWQEADPNGYCTLNSSECIEAQINSTAFELSWRIKLSQNYPQGTKVDVEDPPTIIYDLYWFNGTGSHSGLFLFEPEESTEPGILTGGRKKTPLEEVGVPTPFPYEVAPPEAQYGTIGLVMILTGGVLYYIRRPKTTQQLFRENTAPRVKYGPRKGSGKRGVKSKRTPKRKVQQKKQPKRRVHSKK